MSRSVAIAVIAMVTLAVAGGIRGVTEAAATAPKESVVFWYQHVDPSDQSKFVGARAVITGDQANDTTAITTIHAAGALAIKYTNVYWYPVNGTYEGIDIGAHKDWAF